MSVAADIATFRAAVRLAVAQHVGFARREDDDGEVERLIAAGGTAVALLAAQYRAGSISKQQFTEQATARLSEQARQAGRLGAGQYGEPDDFDEEALGDIEDRISDFAGSVADDGNSDAQIASWALVLGGVAWSMFQRGRVAGAPDVEQWDWICKDDARSCEDCVAMAEGSPYDGEPSSYPGDGNEQCGANCRCKVEPHTDNGGGG